MQKNGNSSVKAKWVKTRVSFKEWTTKYSLETYCFLSKDETGVWIGYIIMADNLIPGRMQELNPRELQQVDQYCKSKNLLPRPQMEVEPKVVNKKIKSIKF